MFSSQPYHQVRVNKFATYITALIQFVIFFFFVKTDLTQVVIVKTAGKRKNSANDFVLNNF